jgi:hypothetical protein
MYVNIPQVIQNCRKNPSTLDRIACQKNPGKWVTVVYSYIVDVYDGHTIFINYILFLTIGVLIVQSYRHLIGIIFSDSLKNAVLFSVSFYTILFLLSNFLCR